MDTGKVALTHMDKYCGRILAHIHVQLYLHVELYLPKCW